MVVIILTCMEEAPASNLGLLTTNVKEDCVAFSVSPTLCNNTLTPTLHLNILFA